MGRHVYPGCLCLSSPPSTLRSLTAIDLSLKNSGGPVNVCPNMMLKWSKPIQVRGLQSHRLINEPGPKILAELAKHQGPPLKLSKFQSAENLAPPPPYSHLGGQFTVDYRASDDESSAASTPAPPTSPVASRMLRMLPQAPLLLRQSARLWRFSQPQESYL